MAGVGIVLGSPKYLAPERLLDGLALPESDLWSLGATLYHAVDGRPPFVRATTAETLRALTDETPEPPRQAGPLTEVIVALLRRVPSARPEPPMVEHALRAVIGQPADRRGLPPAAAPPVPAEPGRKRRIAVAAALIGVLIAVGAVVGLVRPEDRAGSPAVASPPSAAPPAAPAGWYWYISPVGLRVMLPAEFPVSGGVFGVSVAGSATRPHLEISTVADQSANLLETLTTTEGSVGMLDYRRLRMAQLPDGAEWEYTYRSGGLLGDMHALQRLVILDGHVYRFEWEVPARSWVSELSRFNMIVDSFQPSSGG
ncbi:protein kinase domain-containing protein [Paractinoplanes durhamensis]|uniref:protein kinase domain-containing protein n=1 Tax=Paractinoplanes durhamensis TaxID=113563 RepID=UPI003629D2A3